jgi:iron complex outermembrane receptor protein
MWIASAVAAGAESSESTQLPAIEIIGGREISLTVPSVEGARGRINQTPGGVSVVDADTYKAGRTSTLQDALGLTPGVFVQPRFGSEESRLSVRGSGIQRTFHLRGIQVLQDGVPLNQADGSGDFQAIEPLAARYIEVFRGANALQYGSTTLGGAINHVMPTGYDWPRYQARGEAGSFGYRRGQLSTAAAHDALDYVASYSHFSQDGFRDHARQDNQRLFANLGYRIGDNVETRFYVTHVETDSELPGNLTKAQMQNDPRQANPGNLSLNQRRDFELSRLSNRTVYKLGENRFEIGAYYAEKTLFHPIFQVLDVDTQDIGASFRFLSEAPLLGNKNLFVAGFAPAYTRQTDDRFVNVGGQRGARTAESLQTANNFALYAENQHFVTQTTAVVLGAQSTKATRKYEDRFLSNGDNSFDTTYRRTSPKVGVLYAPTATSQFFANVSNSFEPPSFGELAGGPGITQVNAQRATTYELGSRGNGERLGWDVALYRADVKEELLAQNSPTGTPLGTVNAPRTVHQGAETGVSLSAGAVEWRNAYLLNDFRFDGHSTYRDNRLPGVPTHYLKSSLRYNVPGNYYVNLQAEWSPRRYAVDMANTLYADPYTIYGITVGRQIGKGFSWFLEGRNLTDKTYASTTGVIADAGGVDSAQFLPGDGRSFYAGVEWRH